MQGYTGAEGKHDRNSAVKEKETKSKAIVENNKEAYNYCSTFVL